MLHKKRSAWLTIQAKQLSVRVDSLYIKENFVLLSFAKSISTAGVAIDPHVHAFLLKLIALPKAKLP